MLQINNATEPAGRLTALDDLARQIGLAEPKAALDLAVAGIAGHPFDFEPKIAELTAAVAGQISADPERWADVQSALATASRETLEQYCEGDELDERLEAIRRAIRDGWDGVAERFGRLEREAEAKRTAAQRQRLRVEEHAAGLAHVAKTVGEVHNGISALDYALTANLNDEPARDVFLEKMNAEHAVVSIGGAIKYLHRAVDRKGRKELRFLNVESMRSRYAAVRWKNIHDKFVNGFEEWNRWPGRRTFDGVGFFPGSPLNPPKVPRGYLNLWGGFAIEPSAGDWSLFRTHLLEKVCGGDPVKFDWVMDWLADLVQSPQRKSGTALILKSRTEGTGKTMLATALRKIFGQHWTKASSATHILGNFNSPLETCCVLSVEEAIWAGNKQAESVLKDLVTAEELRIERKGADAYVADNFTRLIFTSNEDWVIPAGPESRRYCVLEVANNRAKDPAYFGPIFKQLETGGYEAMLHELLNRDIKSNLREAPVTEGLIEQREQSLDGVDRFIFEFARDGHVSSTETGESYELDENKATTVDLVTLAAAASVNCSTWERRGVQPRACLASCPAVAWVWFRSAPGFRQCRRRRAECC